MAPAKSPLAAVLFAAALAAAVPGMSALFGDLSAGGADPGTSAALALVVTALVGRVVLSLLPQGLPGEHGLAGGESGGLAVTWAASHLLGVILLPLQALLFARLGLGTSPLVLLLPWLLPLAVRMTTLPGDMVPRHGLAVAGARSLFERGLLALVVALSLTPLVLHLVHGSLVVPGTLGAFGAPLLASASPTADPVVGLACLPALALLVHHGLVALELACWLRLAATLLVVATPFGLAASLAAGGVLGTDSLAAGSGLAALAPALPRAQLALGAATALAIPALVRADRRAAFLSILGFLSLAWLTPLTLPAAGPGLVGAGLVTLLLAAPGGLRARLVKPLAGALFLGLAASLWLVVDKLPSEPLAVPTPDVLGAFDSLRGLLRGYELGAFGIVFALVDAAWLIALFLRPWRELPGRRHPRPALLFLFVLALLSLLSCLLGELLLEQLMPELAARFAMALPELLLLYLPGGVLLLAAVAGELGTRAEAAPAAQGTAR